MLEIVCCLNRVMVLCKGSFFLHLSLAIQLFAVNLRSHDTQRIGAFIRGVLAEACSKLHRR